MACNKLHALIDRWMKGREEKIILFEDNDEIILCRDANTLLLSVELTQGRPDNSALESWMRLGRASLSHFQGALAQSPESGRLWLLQHLPCKANKELLSNSLESLLNQRDTWRAIVARLTRPARRFTPTSLRSLPH